MSIPSYWTCAAIQRTAPDIVLKVLDCENVIAVNVPLAFLVIPRLIVSLLPTSILVVVWFVMIFSPEFSVRAFP